MSPEAKQKLELIDRESSPIVDKAHELNISTSYVDNTYKVHFIEDETLNPLIEILQQAKESVSEFEQLVFHESKKTVYLPKQEEAESKHGVWLQLYSLLSKNSLGIGDFRDLFNFITFCSTKNIDFIQINPINAINLSGSLETSPYMPISRFFLSPLYIRPSWTIDFDLLDTYHKDQIRTLEKYASRDNENINYIDYMSVRTNKLQIFEILFANLSEVRKTKLKRFIYDSGEPLDEYCEYQVLRALKNSSNLIRANKEFYAYLEMLGMEQLLECKRHSKEMGLKVGIITDLPVGCHPFGADPQIYKGGFITELNIGAPPDNFNQLGQNWGMNPLNPFYLEKTDYKPYRDLFKKVFSYSGAVRIDHVLGLFRVWSIPPQADATSGSYINYNYKKIFEILTEEARKAGAIVIGEDLGTVPSYVRPYMKKNEILGTKLLVQQIENGKLIEADKIKREILLTMLTHDHPPFYSYLSGKYIDFFYRLGILKTPEKSHLEHKEFQELFFKAIGVKGFEPLSRDETSKSHKEHEIEKFKEVVFKAYKYLFSASSNLIASSLMDLTLQKVSINIPGTSSEYPNWSIPLQDTYKKNVLLEDLVKLDLVNKVFEL